MNEDKNKIIVDNKKGEALYVSMLVIVLVVVMLAGVHTGYIDKNFLKEPEKFFYIFPFGTMYYWFATLFL